LPFGIPFGKKSRNLLLVRVASSLLIMIMNYNNASEYKEKSNRMVEEPKRFITLIFSFRVQKYQNPPIPKMQSKR